MREPTVPKTLQTSFTSSMPQDVEWQKHSISSGRKSSENPPGYRRAFCLQNFLKLMPGGRLELPTRGFSILCSTDWAIPACISILSAQLKYQTWPRFASTYANFSEQGRHDRAATRSRSKIFRLSPTVRRDFLGLTAILRSNLDTIRKWPVTSSFLEICCHDS